MGSCEAGYQAGLGLSYFMIQLGNRMDFRHELASLSPSNVAQSECRCNKLEVHDILWRLRYEGQLAWAACQKLRLEILRPSTLAQLKHGKNPGHDLTRIDVSSCCAVFAMLAPTSLLKRSSQARPSNVGVISLTLSESCGPNCQ